MTYGYGFEYGTQEMDFGNMMYLEEMLLGIVLILVILSFAFSVVSYVLSSVGMYRIAKRRGIHHAWLAWIPVGNSWLLGSISDHYQYVVKHKNTNRRKVLLILQLICSASGLVFGVLSLVLGLSNDGLGAMGLTAVIILTYLVLLGVAIAVTVVSYIAYYDLFQSSKPGYAVLFLVLSVIFNVTLPFFVFACSNSDKGMPARRTVKPQELEPSEPEKPEEEIPVVQTQLIDESFEE